MLIRLKDILAKYNLSPNGVVHVGAHWAEEHDDYLSCGIKSFVYVEPCKEAFATLENKFIGCNCDVILANVACGAKESESVMYASPNNQGQSNSLLEPSLHLQQHPEVIFTDAELVKVVTLDSIVNSCKDYDMLVMDCQGYEGEVLKGAKETLKNIDIVYTEVNRGETYKGNMLIDGIDELLSDFARVETYWPSPNWTWGDAIYVRTRFIFKQNWETKIGLDVR